MTYEGRVAFVNGGAGGIGSAVCRQLHEAGAKVAIADIAADRARALAEELDGCDQTSCLPVAMDVRDPDSVEAAVDSACRHLGVVDALFNVTGVTGTNTALHEVSLAEFDDTVSVNLRGYLLTLQAVTRRLIEHSRAGTVVNVGSGGGVRPGGRGGLPAYCISKAAVHAMTAAAARDLAPHGIRVNTVAPGPVVTPMTQRSVDDPDRRRTLEDRVPLGRIAEPDDIAGLMLFVASDAGRNMTGAVLSNDGGATL